MYNETNINKNTCRACAFLRKRDSFLSKQTHKWDDNGEEEEEEEGIEIILPEIVPELFTSNEAWISHCGSDRTTHTCSSNVQYLGDI